MTGSYTVPKSEAISASEYDDIHERSVTNRGSIIRPVKGGRVAAPVLAQSEQRAPYAGSAMMPGKNR